MSGVPLKLALLAAVPVGTVAAAVAIARPGTGQTVESRPRQFHFTRARYSNFYPWNRPGSWSVDYPEADRHFVIGLKRLTNVDAADLENPVSLADPRMRRYPFIYTVEVGYMSLTREEVEGLRSYLLAGGFLMVDDFWGSREWANFEREIERVLPEYPIVDVPADHPVRTLFFGIDSILQVPALGRGVGGRPSWEQDGFVPRLMGIFDDRGRLMVLINWNSDLGDAWEHADDPRYPLTYSSFAYRLGVNAVIFALSH